MIKALRVLLIRTPNPHYHGLARMLIPGINPNIFGSSQGILSLASFPADVSIDLIRGSKSTAINEELFYANPALPANVLAHLVSKGLYPESNELHIGSIEGLVVREEFGKNNLFSSLLYEAQKNGLPAYSLDEKYCLNQVMPDGSLQPHLPEDILSFDPRMGEKSLQSMRDRLKEGYENYILEHAQSATIKGYKEFLNKKKSGLLEPVTQEVVGDVYSLAAMENPEYAEQLKEIREALEKEKIKNQSPLSTASAREEHEKILAQAAVKDEKYLWDPITTG